MDFRHPVRTLQWAIMQASERDLNGMQVDPVSLLLII